MPGPESTALASKALGVIVSEGQSENGLTELVIFHLPSLKRTSLTPHTAGSAQIIAGVSGPDENGAVAYIHATIEKHYLKTVNIDGTEDQVIFERPGGFANTGLRDLAMAPKGGHIAFLNAVRSSNGIQLEAPRTYLQLGSLEIWDIKRKAPLNVPPIQAVSTWSTPFLSWFPDGETLAYVQLIPKEQAPLPRVELDEFVAAYPGWNQVPVITVFDLQIGRETVVHSGFAPVVSCDGDDMLAQFTNEWMVLVNTTSKSSHRIQVPGAYSFVVAIPNHSLFLYWGLPTQGAAPTYSPYGSFRAGLQMVSLKVADASTGKFQTVVYPIDPRNAASFGRDRSSLGQ